jgi:hypothetical protein
MGNGLTKFSGAFAILLVTGGAMATPIARQFDLVCQGTMTDRATSAMIDRTHNVDVTSTKSRPSTH